MAGGATRSAPADSESEVFNMKKMYVITIQDKACQMKLTDEQAKAITALTEYLIGDGFGEAIITTKEDTIQTHIALLGQDYSTASAEIDSWGPVVKIKD